MNARTSHEEIKAIRTNRDRAASLLTRYPGLSGEETQEVLRFLKTARHLDVGLLSSDDAIRPRLDAFMEDHRKQFAIGLDEAGKVIAALVAVFIVLLLLWELGAGNVG
jgi:hypothetical protein